MKKTSLFLSLIMTATLALGMGGGWLPGVTNIAPVPPAVTNSPQVPDLPPDTPPVVTPAPAGVIAQGDFYRPAVCVNGDGSIVVACEGHRLNTLYKWINTGSGWKGGQVVKGTMQTAMRVYVCNLLPGAKAGDEILSARYGPKDGGRIQGPMTFIKGVEKFEGFSTGMARLAMDKTGPILMSKNGVYKNLRTGEVKSYNAGGTGEKLAFAISGDTWATCMGGYSVEPSAVTINGKRQVWADYATYGAEYGSDLLYPAICIASDGSVWCAEVLKGGLRVQHVTGGKLAYPIKALPSIGDASDEQRHAPVLIVQGGTVQAVWRNIHGIYRVDVAKALKGKQTPKLIAMGAYPAAAVDAAGNLWVVYVSGGAIKILGPL
ncbi:MAG: hypothetical protein ACOYOU_16335 [Kiritimatiellia bacterium]